MQRRVKWDMSGNRLRTDRARTDRVRRPLTTLAGVERVSSWIGSSLFPLPAHSPRTAGRRPSLVAPTGRRSAGPARQPPHPRPFGVSTRGVALWIAYPCHPLPRGELGRMRDWPTGASAAPAVGQRLPASRPLCDAFCVRGVAQEGPAVVHTEWPAGAEARGQPLFPACRPGPGRRLACLGDVRSRPVRAGVVVLSAGDAVRYAPLTGPRDG